MDTQEFLRLILPSKGYYFLALPTPSGGYKHKAFTCTDKLANAALLAAKGGVNAYMACSSFTQPEYIGADGKKHWRGAENAAFVRSQWMDMDGDKAANLKDLIAFCATTTLPRPNVMVDSGNGIHVYWVFDRDVEPAVWKKTADLFKSLTAHLNLAQKDTTRTADLSSVLRPAGTVNDKSHKGLGVKPVKVVGTVREERVVFSDWVRKLVELKGVYGLRAPKASTPKANINSDLGGGPEEHPASSAVTIAEHCAQIKFFRDYKGASQTEPVWRNCLGVMKHTVEGAELAHEWSSGHAEYDTASCQQKMDNWTAGPTTCERFKQDSPALCAGCPHTVLTPIFLGRVAPEPVSQVEVFNPATEEVVVDEAPVFSDEMLKRFRPTEHGISALKEDDEGVKNWVLICDKWVYPYQYYCDADDGNQWKLRISVRVRPGEWKDAEIAAKALYSGGVTLRAELGGKAMLGATPGNDKTLEIFMRTAADELQASMVETAMHEYMGWQEDQSFIVGSKRYSADGTVREIVLSKNLRTEQKSFSQSGNLARYTELINHAYNRPKHEPYQFTWMAGLASPLIKLMCNDLVGIVFSAWSPESGFGKSTAAKLAAGLWHDPAKVVGASQTTPYALYVNAGYRRNLPLVVDEISTWDAKTMSSFGYIYSGGQAKQQGQAEGGLKDNSHLNWVNCVITTSNRSVLETMAAHATLQTIPQMMRVFEYRFDAGHDETMPIDEGRIVMNELMQMRGIVGPVFMRAVVQKQDAVREMLDDAYLMFARESELPKDARFWLYGAAASWVAFNISKKLGLHSFDGRTYRAWIITRLIEMHSNVARSKPDMLALFGDMVADLQGGMIVTLNDGDARSASGAVLAPNHRLPYGEITGRMVVNDKRMHLKVAAVREWCNNHGISMAELKGALRTKGWLVGSGQVYLARGLTMALPKAAAWTIDWDSCSGNMRVATINGANVHDEVAA